MADFEYDLIPIPLDQAGERYFPYPGSYLLFQDARAGAVKAANTLLQVKLGKQGGGKWAWWELNNRARGSFEGFTVKWDAVPGVVAYMYVSQGPRVLELESPPAKQLVTSSVGTALSASAVSVSNIATLLSDTDETRQSVTIQPIDGDLFIGPAGVTSASGLKVAMGDAFVIDKTVAPIYGITAGGTVDVRVLEEHS